MERPGDVILREAHWRVSRNEPIENMPYSLPAHQALPVHVNANSARMAGESATERYSHDPKVWEGLVVDLLKEILNLQADMVVMLLSMLEGEDYLKRKEDELL